MRQSQLPFMASIRAGILALICLQLPGAARRMPASLHNLLQERNETHPQGSLDPQLQQMPASEHQSHPHAHVVEESLLEETVNTTGRTSPSLLQSGRNTLNVSSHGFVHLLAANFGFAFPGNLAALSIRIRFMMLLVLLGVFMCIGCVYYLGTSTMEDAKDSVAAVAPATWRGGIDVQWQDIECFVASEPEHKQGRVAKWLGLSDVEGPPTKQIIKGASGFAKAGEVLAVMGPSGSGKTTLMNVLAQRPTLGKKGYWRGSLLLNGQDPWHDWEREMSYVMQKDIFYDELKVHENLLTTALLRLPSDWTRSEKVACLDRKIDEMGLQHVKNKRIGTATDRGLSGGEVKRTSIANESLALPRIFFLDEPLTGLDSSRAVDVMQMLRKLAHNEGTTVMLTIHQPSSALYSCFDSLLMLGTGGRTAFFGHVSGAVVHFSKIGHPVPSLWAPSDHFIELLTLQETKDKVCEAWAAATQPLAPALSARPPTLTPMPTFTAQVGVLFPRSFKRICRSYLNALAWKLQIGLAFVWGFIYFQVGLHAHSRLTDIVGALFFVVAHWSWTPLFQGLGNFPREKEMLTKERASKVYEIRSFFAAQVLAEAPLLLGLPCVFFAIVWPMAALPGQVVVQVFLIVALNIQVCASMSMLVSAVCMDEQRASSTAIVVMVLQMCAGGYFADMRSMPWFIGWVRFISNYFYSFGAILRLMVLEPFGEELHQQAIAKYSFSELGYFWEVVMLIVMIVIVRLLTYVQLSTTKKLQFS